jgi:hypothetical protein
MKTIHSQASPSSRFPDAFPTHGAGRETTRSLLAHLVTASLAILPLPAVAQDADKLPLSVFCVEFATSLKSVYLRSSGKRHTKVDLSTANVVAAGDAPLVNGLVTLHGPPLSGNKYPVVASVKPGAIRKPLMVLVPNPQTAEPGYQSTVVDMDTAPFPLGSYQIVNLSPHPLRFKTDGKTTDIAPNAQMTFNPALKDGEVAAVTVEYKLGEDWLVASSSRWAGRMDRRTLVCIHQNPQTKRMLIKSIPLRE